MHGLEDIRAMNERARRDAEKAQAYKALELVRELAEIDTAGCSAKLQRLCAWARDIVAGK